MVEYPVKTMNANERDMVYQTDTGPVLLPDLSAETEKLFDGDGAGVRGVQLRGLD